MEIYNKVSFIDDILKPTSNSEPRGSFFLDKSTKEYKIEREVQKSTKEMEKYKKVQKKKKSTKGNASKGVGVW